MVNITQIVAVVFITFTASRSILRAKDKKISLRELLFWLAVWGTLLFVVFFPHITTYIATWAGIGRGIDVIIYASLGILYYLVFRLYVKLEEIEMEITKLVREIAIHSKKKK